MSLPPLLVSLSLFSLSHALKPETNSTAAALLSSSAKKVETYTSTFLPLAASRITEFSQVSPAISGTETFCAAA